MGLDAIHDWNCQHLDKNKGRLKIEYMFSSVCLYLGTNCYLCVCVHATLPTLGVVRSGGALATNIQSHHKNYVRQQSLYIPRTEQMERVIQWNKHIGERCTGWTKLALGVLGGRWGKKSWRKQHLAGLCSGLPTALIDLRWRINLLIEVTFVLNTMSSVYFKHIFLSLNLPPTLQMSSFLSVLWPNGIMRDRTTYGLYWSPSLSGGVILPPTAFCPALLSDDQLVQQYDGTSSTISHR